MKQREFLVVSASTGTGHARAGDAVREAIIARDGSAIVEHFDLLKLAPRWVRATYGGGYELIATRTPRLWREIYSRTDLPSPDLARWGPAIHRTLFREFRRLLFSRRWSACICTHFLPGQIAAGTPGAPPFSMVITDLTLHHFWAQPRVGRFFVANHQLADDLRPRVRGSTVEVTGIPISSRFGTPPERWEARQALGLDPSRPTVLVMGGGLGLGVEESARAAVEANVPGLQVVVVCGRNIGAHQALIGSGYASERLRCVGYVRDIERYVAAADLVVTKPGGLTASEVLAVGRPMLLTRPIPGQEEGNSRSLRDAGVALEAPTPALVRSAVEHVFSEPGILLGLEGGARRLGRPRAGDQIAGAVLADTEAVIAA